MARPALELNEVDKKRVQMRKDEIAALLADPKNPVNQGSPTVRMLPPLDYDASPLHPAAEQLVSPVLPFNKMENQHGTLLVPGAELNLLVVDPRYQQMLKHIQGEDGDQMPIPDFAPGKLRPGCFVAAQIEFESLTLAETGVMIQVDSVRESTSEPKWQTAVVNGERKVQQVSYPEYYVDATVLGRVRLTRIVSPLEILGMQYEQRPGHYLICEVEEIPEDIGGEAEGEVEARIADLVQDLRKLQGNIQVAVLSSLAPEPSSSNSPENGSTDSIWDVLPTWRTYLQGRGPAEFREAQVELTKQAAAIIPKDPETGEIPDLNDLEFDELPKDVQERLKVVLSNFKELEALTRQLPKEDNVLGWRGLMQEFLQANSHKERLEVFEGVLRKERDRLTARVTMVQSSKL